MTTISPYKPGKKRVDGHTVFVYSLLFIGALLLLVPFYWMLSNSLKTEAEAKHTPPTLLPMASYIEIEGKPLEVSLGQKYKVDKTIRVTVKMPEHPDVGKTVRVPQADITSPIVAMIEEDGAYISFSQSKDLGGGMMQITLSTGEIREVTSSQVLAVTPIDYDDGHPTLFSLGEEVGDGIRKATVLKQPHPFDGAQYRMAESDVQRKLTPRWGNYPKSLQRMNFTGALANTTVITVLCVIGQILSSSLVGFGFARFRFRGRNFLFMLMLSTMMLPPQVSMIPLFILFRNLGMIDTIWPLVIPMWLGSPFYVFMFRQFFTQVPEELVEAARIDGASNTMIYWRLMLPLSGPVIAIVSIYTFMFVWNDFLGPLIYLNSPDQRTLTLALNAFNGNYGVSDVQLLMAASFVTMLPCILLFFAAQRYFVQSTASSGLKG